MMTAIKPCPFCGAAPSLHPEDPKRDGNAWGSVRCDNRRCATYHPVHQHGVEVKDGVLMCDDRGSASYIRSAIRRWNRRRA